MALTVNVTRRIISGNQRIVVGNVDFDSSYPTGGESFTAADLGLRVIDLVVLQSGSKGFAYEYDYTNSKILVYSQGAAHATGGAVTMDDYAVTAGPGVTSGISLSFETGAGAITHRWGPMKEIASTDDLSTVTGVRFIVYGV